MNNLSHPTVLEKKENCSGCGACLNTCPKNCISMAVDIEGFFYPTIDLTKCSKCGLCAKICPSNIAKREEQKPTTYALFNNDLEVRKNSSSGGAFTLIANAILRDGGVVFGVAMAEDNHSAKHIIIEDKEDLQKLRTSKYLQSDTGKTFHIAKDYLEEGRKVLYTGTPCQIAGLRAFLGKDYDNLLTQDVICHGVPSGAVWKEYVKQCEKQNNSSVISVNFRDKTKGWKNSGLALTFANNKTIAYTHTANLFFMGFTSNLYLRPSCHSCNFKLGNILSDITLGDLWGAKQICPELDDDIGLSLVLVNTNKGREIFESIKGECTVKEISIEQGIQKNTAIIKSHIPHKNRSVFFENLNRLGVKKAIKKYSKLPFKKRLYFSLYKLKRKIFNKGIY